MLDDHADGSTTTEDGSAAPDPAPAAKKTARKRTTKKAAASADGSTGAAAEAAPSPDTPEAGEPPARKSRAKAAKKTASKTPAPDGDTPEPADTPEKPKKATRSRSKKAAATADAGSDTGSDTGTDTGTATAESARPSVAAVFQAPEKTTAPARRTSKKAGSAASEGTDEGPDGSESAGTVESSTGDASAETDDENGDSPARRKRRRGGRRRRKSGTGESAGADQAGSDADDSDDENDASAAGSPQADAGEGGEGGSTSSRRRRRRRRAGEDGADGSDDPANTVTKVRSGRSAADEITAVTGSTRLEAKKQRRREGREAGRRRAPIVSEAEFLARRESVNRVMVVRQRDDVTQIGVLEDNVLVEHYVARESQTSLIGNVYLGRVQNVLPSMEAAFIDIGKGRNAVLYAGEVNWSALGHKDGQPRKIESVLSSGQTVLVQVTKDPIGHKGARLTSQISLAGRFLVYVPDGTTSGISRKLPDTERNRLKTLLKEIVPEHAGVIVRTAAEGAAEDELTRDVERLTARWDDIEKKAKGSAPQLLYGEPDLTLKVVRDLFTEDFAKLVIEGDDAWETVQGYVAHVAPDLEDRLERYERKKDQDVFAAYRIDEQIKKGLDRKVWLPSGGSLIIDRTEAMTVVDVNTGKFTGSGGNLEETVTKNNLEAAEEIVRQLRLRDIGGIIVVDFIDMVLESNRDLVLRRLVECLGRDRTRHQVAEVTSLGLVQMTRKRIGTGLLESFSHDCPHCQGRGVVVEDAPVEPKRTEDEPRRGRSRRSRGGRGQENDAAEPVEPPKPPSPKDVAAMARQHEEHREDQHEDQHEPQHEQEQATAEPEVLADDPTDAAAAATEEIEPDEPDEPDESVSEREPQAEPESEPELQAREPQPEPSEPSERSEPETVAPVTPAEPEKPRVVTRSRRRAASRPAGPPAAVSHESGSDAAGDARSGGGEVAEADQPADEAPALHVPVKRKGARKR